MAKLFTATSLDSGIAASRCNRLLVLLLGLLAMQPFVSGTLGSVIIGVTFLSVIGQAAAALADSDRHRITVLTLGGLSTLALIVHIVRPLGSTEEYAFVPALLALFVAYVGWTMLGFVVRGNADTRTRLSAALCVYLLAGLAWSMIYVMVFLIDPASFTGAPIQELVANRADPAYTSDAFPVFTYFSYVTLTTLGYGDITPVSPHARTLVILEAIGGVLYVGVMVASLVGDRSTQSVE